jgi:Zn-dependent peptidase ImmA (M78 family)
LSCYGPGTEGLTAFSRTKNPSVKISESVHRYQNRLRTTLTHEYGHVILHNYLFALEDRQLSFGPNHKANTIYCKRDSILPRGAKDWMEWQAGYASGAALMPKSHVTKVVAEVQGRFGVYGPVSAESPTGKEMIPAVIDSFEVSRDAATVRLKVLGFIGPEQAARSLFA